MRPEEGLPRSLETQKSNGHILRSQHRTARGTTPPQASVWKFKTTLPNNFRAEKSPWKRPWVPRGACGAALESEVCLLGQEAGGPWTE